MAESLSLDYRHKLAMSKEEVGKLKAAVYLRIRNRIECQCRIDRNIKRMEGKSKGESTTQINTTNSDGITTEYTSKEPIEKIIANGNDQNSHQCEGRSQLLIQQFILDLGEHGERPFTDRVLDGTYVMLEGTSTAISDFLHACKSHVNIGDVPIDQDIRHRYLETKILWNIQRESTCTYH